MQQVIELKTPTCRDCASAMGYKFNRPLRSGWEGRCANCKQIKFLNSTTDYIDTRN